MPAPDAFALVRKFQWLVIPHGLGAMSAAGKRPLRLTIRV
jgi:hypothetical protein